MRIEFKRRDLKEFKTVAFNRPLSIRAVVTDTFKRLIDHRRRWMYV